MMKYSDIPVFILCGGKGTRLREETETKPKPMVSIGGMPIIWHIMKHFDHYGFRKFVLLLGYKGEQIKDFFLNYETRVGDFTLQLNRLGREDAITNRMRQLPDWQITFAETGEDTQTGGRIFRAAQRHLQTDTFLATYGDGVSNVNLDALMTQHQKMGKLATMTAIHPMSPFGIVETENNLAKSFKEKPRLPGLINGGFFAFNRGILKYLDEDCILEEEPLRALTAEKQLAIYEHQDFWTCMDTFKDVERLNAMYEKGEHPWMSWEAKR
jgi:glucose-1-phosphate cytidylyltransferase